MEGKAQLSSRSFPTGLALGAGLLTPGTEEEQYSGRADGLRTTSVWKSGGRPFQDVTASAHSHIRSPGAIVPWETVL